MAIAGKVDEKVRIVGFCEQGAFLDSTECCGLRFCYVWRPTLNSKCPRWGLPDRMTTTGDSG